MSECPLSKVLSHIDKMTPLKTDIPLPVVIRQCALRKQLAKLEGELLLLKVQVDIDKTMYEYERDTMDKYGKTDVIFRITKLELDMKIIQNQIAKLLDEIINCKMPN
jgi:hypothetical protein